MHAFYQKPSTSKMDPSIQAETKCVMLAIQHNSFFNISDHLSPLIRSEFRGSQAAENFSCGRTKTAAIVNCLGDHFFEKLKSDMQEMPYSLMLDGSNDTGLSKTFPITVRVFDVNFNRVMTKFFDMNLIDGTDASTAETMFQSVDNQLNNHDISWDYCLAIGLDNTNVILRITIPLNLELRKRTEVLPWLVAPVIYYIMHRVKLAKCFLK